MENNRDNSEINDTEGASAARGRGRGIRIEPDQPQLRRPHQPPPAAPAMRRSVLSADAAEFVPKGFSMSSHGQPRTSVQDRLQLAREEQNVHHAMVQRQQQFDWQQNSGGNAPPYEQQDYPDMVYQSMPYQQQQYNQFPVIQDYGRYEGGSGNSVNNSTDHGGSSDLDHTLMQLESAMRSLTMDPGKFDSLVTHLVDDILLFLDQASHSEKILNAIIQQSIGEINFRYTGARLCNHLDMAANTVVFRQTLINKCKEKTEEQIETWRQITKHTDDVEKKCHGLIFFLAELVTQMLSDPASELGKLLIRLINTVLQNPAPTSAKNICQALKLAGQTLERANSENRNEMEQVMKTLSDLVIQGRVDSNVSRMVNSVTELRSGNWGEASLTQHTQPSARVESENQRNRMPIYCSQDIPELTEEENRFLEEMTAEEMAKHEAWENDEDDMIAEAYEEFLEYAKNNNTANQNNIKSNNSNEH